MLPHRIHWLAVPKLAPSKVKRVEFLIDGRTRWIEHSGGIRTKPNPPRGNTEGNGFCDEPFEPVRYSWTVQRDNLTLTLAGPRCGEQSILLAT